MAAVDGVTVVAVGAMVAASMEHAVLPVGVALRMGRSEASTVERPEDSMEEQRFTVAVDFMEVVGSTVEAADAANSGSMPKPELE
jgi:hypothetical protein